MGYFAQQALDVLDPDLTIEEQLQKDFPHESIGALRNLAGAFQFSGDDIDKKIRVLSGGEKTRLVMARMLLDPPNFLVLDEPTNHLDLATKEMLVEALKDFDGTMLFVSHDRAFLRGLSNRVLELGGESGTDAQPMPIPARTSSTSRAPARGARHSFLSRVDRRGTTHLRTVAAKNLRERRAPPFVSGSVLHCVRLGMTILMEETLASALLIVLHRHRGPRRGAPAACTARRPARTRVRLRLRVRLREVFHRCRRRRVRAGLASGTRRGRIGPDAQFQLRPRPVTSSCARTSRLPAANPRADWLTFRDVFSVDGREVRDRRARLATLFEDSAD